MKFKYFGSSTQIGDSISLNHLGQVVILEEEVARDLAKNGNVSILPADVFDQIGFTAEELKQYPQPADTENAPATFLYKRDLAYSLWKDFCEDRGAQLVLGTTIEVA
jgi:hypothetical protein